MPVVGAGADELRQRELVDRAAVAVRERLGGDDPVDQMRRENQPTQPDPGRERLAGGSRVHDPLRRQRLERPERVAVVAELAVVVVLDDQPAGRERPFDRDHPPPRDERRPDRELMRRRQQRGVGRAELLDGGALGVDVDRRERQAARAGGLGGGGLDVALDRKRSRAARAERLAQQSEPLREARADHHALRASPGPRGRARRNRRARPAAPAARAGRRSRATETTRRRAPGGSR